MVLVTALMSMSMICVAGGGKSAGCHEHTTIRLPAIDPSGKSKYKIDPPEEVQNLEEK